MMMPMVKIACLIVFGLIPAVVATDPIVTRHDVPDEAYVDYAVELPVTSSVIRYNTTDVAGTLISPDWLLSAAHVAETIEPGRLLITARGDTVEVKAVVLHPGWIEHGRPEDVALIRLTAAVEDHPFVEIYTGHDEVGQTVVIVGNGDHGTGRSGPVENDGRMRAATNLVNDATDHYLTWTFDDPDVHPSRATQLEGVSGPGDSGGPAFLQIGEAYVLAGISSGQSTSATGGLEGRYGVTEYYTRVSIYQDWIDATLRDPR